MKKKIAEYFDINIKEVNGQESDLFIVNFSFNRNLASKTIQFFDNEQKENERTHFLFMHNKRFVYEYDI